MRTRVILLFVVFMGCGLLGVAAAQGAGIELAVGGWHQDPGGDIGYKAVAVGDILDVGRDLRYDTENRVLGRIKIDMPAFFPNLYLAAAPSEFEARGQKNVNFRFGDQEFDGRFDFDSKLKMNQYDVGLYYGLPFVHTATAGILNVDAGLNVRIFDLEARIRQEETGISENETLTLPLPQLYLAFQLTPVRWFAVEAEGRGLTIGGNSVYSLIGRLRFNVLGPAFVAAGYRYDRVDVDEDDLRVDFTIQGPFVEVGLAF